MQREFRRRFASLLSVFAAVVFTHIAFVQAQDYPNKPVNIILPISPGGIPDLMHRAMAPYVPEYFNGQTFVTHFREGGAGAIGANEAAQAKPDGYTLLSANSNGQTVAVAATGRGKGPDDLAAVCRITNTISVYWVRTDAPWKTFPELISYAKANPGKLIYGNTFPWSSQDFAWKWLEMKAGFTSKNVPTGGGAELLVSVLGGHTQVGRIGFPQSIAHYKAGKLRPLAVHGAVRRKELPDVPALVELGYDMGEVGANWYGIVAPKGTPRAIINRIAEGFSKLTQDKRAIATADQVGLEFAYLGPDEFGKRWKNEYETYKELIKMFKK